MKLLPVAALATVALSSASAAAQAPGLPRTFDVTRIDSAAPVPGGAFGWGLWSADLTGDGKQDLLVAQGQLGTAAVPTQVLIYDGATGAHIDTILPPEDNPLEPPAPPAAAGNPPIAPAPATLYGSPELAFVYVETMPDLGSCPAGDGPDAGRICDDALIGPGDGIPEIIVGARALRVNATDGAIPPTFNDPKIGRGYVIDGKTRAVLKRIDMPQVDRQAFLTRTGTRRDGVPTTVAAFARTMASPQGLPPCAGLAGENNDSGVGPCPALTRGTGDTTSGSRTVANVDLPAAKNGQMIVGPGIPRGTRITAGGGTATLTISANATATATGVALEASDPRYPQTVRIGDIDGGGKPDIVITARGFAETPGPLGSAFPGSECRTNTTATANCGAGKIWTYRGEDIAGTSPEAILDTAHQSIQNPDAQTTGGEYGGNLYRVGDIVGPTTTNAAPDGIPDYVISFRGSDLPLKAPDLGLGLNAGSADLFSGATGNRIRTLISPEPQQRSTFSGGFNAGRSVGDLGATDSDDILLAAPFQNLQYADQGRLWVFNGDATAGGGGEQSWNFGMLNDPEPYIGGNFGGSQTGVGDIVGGPGAPANEVLVAGFRFDNFTEASQNTPPDLNFMNGTLDRNLMTIPHPESKTGDGFGVGLTPMGDINDDGFLDFSASAYFADGPFGGQGRAWIFKSNNASLPPAPTTPAPAAAGPTTPATENEPLRAGACTNRTIGTDLTETIEGTLAGDEIFGFGGNDRIRGFAGRDCIDGQRGNDTLRGDDDNDKIVGGRGADKIYGDDGRDSLFGGSGRDQLSGGFGRDMLAGGAGNDNLHGGPDADRLFGEAGTDRIIAGGGQNEIDGGAGNDSIDARNGERDRVVCGRGRDSVRADRGDRLNGCEVVTRGGRIKYR